MTYNLKTTAIFFLCLAVLAPQYCLAESFDSCAALYRPGTYNEARVCLNGIAAKRVDTDRATFLLGAIFAEGKGVEPNLVEAYKWFIVSKHFDSTNTLAGTMISACERELTELEIKQGRALAAQWINSKTNSANAESLKQKNSSTRSTENAKPSKLEATSDKLIGLREEFSKAKSFEMTKGKSAAEKAQYWYDISIRYPNQPVYNQEYALLRAQAIAKAGYWNEVALSTSRKSQNNKTEAETKNSQLTAQRNAESSNITTSTSATASGIISWKTDRSSLNFHEMTVVRTKDLDKSSGLATTKFEIFKNEESIARVSNDGLDKTFIYRNFPAPGFNTLVLEVMSRGNGGYCDSLILTNDGVFTYITEFKNLTLGLSHNDENYFTTIDNHFSYYSVGTGDKKISLCSACAPYPKRAIIFVGQSWRFDRPGENNKYYATLYSEAVDEYKKLAVVREKNDAMVVSKAILAAYYLSMMKESEAKLKQTLTLLLPSSVNTAASKTVSDINTAILSIAKRKSGS